MNMKIINRVVPCVVVLLALAYLGAMALSRPFRSAGMSAETINYLDFASTPVMDKGRIKPLDSVARIYLMVISGRQTWKDEDKVRRQAIEWLLDVMVTQPVKNDLKLFDGPAVKHKVFRIENEEVMSLLGLEARPGLVYAPEEFIPRLEEFYKVAHLANKIDTKKRSLYQAKVVELAQHLEIFLELASLKAPLSLPLKLPDGEEDWLCLADVLRQGMDVVQRHPGANAQVGMLIAYLQAKRDPVKHPDAIENFNQHLQDYRDFMAQDWSRQMSNSKLEVFYNKFQPFYQAVVLYVWVFILGVLSWLVWPKALNRAAFWLGVVACTVQFLGLLARMILQDRPLVMVTNLYSSAIFIGWVGAMFGLGIDLIFRNSIGTVVAAVLGGLTQTIAHYLSQGGDTMETLQAVLDTNLWLATHVTSITIGYGAVFVAGCIGVIYLFFDLLAFLTRSFCRLHPSEPLYQVVLAGSIIVAFVGFGLQVLSIVVLFGVFEMPVFLPFISGFSLLVLGLLPLAALHYSAPVRSVAFQASIDPVQKCLSVAVYGVVCFGLLFSFVGTTLGGIWADQSWGRFWGWDPKENGALLIVLWNALVLHARWAGLIKQRGLVSLAIIGNVVTAWSWFGVNMLGVGLHSYGFMSGALAWLLVFACTQFIFAGLALVPWSTLVPPLPTRNLEPRMNAD